MLELVHKNFIVWGSAGHCKVINDIIEARSGKIVALVDSSSDAQPSIPNVPLYHGSDGLRFWMERNPTSDIFGAIAIGGAKGQSRQEIANEMIGYGIYMPPLIHTTASISNSAIIGNGSHVLANAVIAAEANIGNYCIINNSANVDHESIVGNGSHIAPGAILCGCVSVGENTLIGAGSIILPHIKIGRNVIVGAGAVVTKNVPEGMIVVGNPAIQFK